MREINRDIGILRQASHEFEKQSLRLIAHGLGDKVVEHGFEGLRVAVREYMHKQNIVPKYTQENSVEFSNMRRSLTERPGVFIANHPSGYIDIPVTLTMVDRDDVLIYAQDRVRSGLVRGLAEKYGDGVGQVVAEKLLSNDPSLAKSNFQTALRHVESGGLIVLYPTAGREGHTLPLVTFRPGFRLLLRLLKPETMVYAAHFNVSHARSPGVLAGRATAMVLPKPLQEVVRKPIVVTVDEQLTTVADWSSSLNDDQAVTRRYAQMFNIEF